MNGSSNAALTLPEILVVLVLLLILAALALPNTGNGLRMGNETRVLSNMKQLHLATQQMALDATTTGDSNIGWPGDLDGSFERWATNLVGGNYLSTNDFCKLLSAGKRTNRPGVMPGGNTNGVLVYAVSELSESNAVFLTSANFTNTPTGGVSPLKGAEPFGEKGFVVFRKGGDGVILQNRQAGPAYTNIIGAYVPLCTSPAAVPAGPAEFTLDWPTLIVAVGAALLMLAGLVWTFSTGYAAPATPLVRARELLRGMKHLHLATQQMALERETSGNQALGWPGDTDGTFATWAGSLVTGGFAKADALHRMLDGTTGRKRRWLEKRHTTIPAENTHAIRVYAVREDSPPSTICYCTANFTPTPQGGTLENFPLLEGQYFVVMTRDGRGFLVALHPPEPDEELPRNVLSAEDWAHLPRTVVPLCS